MAVKSRGLLKHHMQALAAAGHCAGYGAERFIFYRRLPPGCAPGELKQRCIEQVTGRWTLRIKRCQGPVEKAAACFYNRCKTGHSTSVPN